jgi:anti-sigma regulatory factor (Ser/Thr protein kinase)
MSKLRKREEVSRFIIENIEKSPKGICRLASQRFGISTQAVNNHLRRLIEANLIEPCGKTRNRSYKLRPLTEWRGTYNIDGTLAEHVVWKNDVSKIIGTMPDNVLDIWHYGFTEMFNNAIDHSSGTGITVFIRKDALNTEMLLLDDGVGIFKKIHRELGLEDERHAILELTKGKLTTDPKHHTGEGIFFTSRMFDSFDILSGGTFFTHKFGDTHDWVLQLNVSQDGTGVWMRLANNTARTAKKIFDKFTSGDDYGFNKTIIPVELAQYGNDKLISRSQAKRLMARVDRFKVVIFDFKGVDFIGPAFADEIFRVFANEHPEIEMLHVHASKDVEAMIQKARGVRMGLASLEKIP